MPHLGWALCGFYSRFLTGPPLSAAGGPLPIPPAIRIVPEKQATTGLVLGKDVISAGAISQCIVLKVSDFEVGVGEMTSAHTLPLRSLSDKDVTRPGGPTFSRLQSGPWRPISPEKRVLRRLRG